MAVTLCRETGTAGPYEYSGPANDSSEDDCMIMGAKVIKAKLEKKA